MGRRDGTFLHDATGLDAVIPEWTRRTGRANVRWLTEEATSFSSRR